MVRTYAYSANFDKELEKLFREAKFLGEGHNGIVYELPEDKAVKIFTNKDICREEAKILYKVKLLLLLISPILHGKLTIIPYIIFHNKYEIISFLVFFFKNSMHFISLKK